MDGEYVSKAAAINKIMESIVHQDSHDVNLHNIGLRKAMSAIDSLPAADVVEVRHGRWIAQPPDFDLCGVAYYQCSECGKEQQTPSNYCQFCGAKMDGKSADYAPAKPYDLLYEEGGPDA